jgi:hypothetical protein
MNVHIYKPETIDKSFRILPKYCRKFIKPKFDDFLKALDFGIVHYKQGFRVFHQHCFEWHEPLNILLAKIENITEVVK